MESNTDFIIGLFKYFFTMNFGSFSSIMFSLFVMVCGFFAGLYAKTVLRKISVISIILFFSYGFYMGGDNYLHGGMSAISVFLLSTIPMTTALILSGLAESGYEEELKGKTDMERVQLIDDSLNCVVGVNNSWAKKNWNELEDDMKVAWISTNRDALNETLGKVDNAAELISLMQQIERAKKAS